MGKKKKVHPSRRRSASLTPDKGTAPHVQRTHKDTLFRFIFRDKRKLLELYNAINGSDYQDVNGLTVTTLENVIYIGYKNDVSFLLDRQLCLIEQQSTWNPNAPLRGLLYFARLYREYVARENLDLYGSKQLSLPFPQYVIFYNGTSEKPEREVMKLSDSFAKAPHTMGIDGMSESDADKASRTDRELLPALECRALVLNINYGKNQELLNRCKPLLDYSCFIYYIREGTRKGLTAQEAMDQAIERCLKEDILSDVLTAHRKEVVSMFLEEYDEELHYRTLRREGYEDGRDDGRMEGEARVGLLHQRLVNDKRLDDLQRSCTDAAFRKKLFDEYGL
jgi:hypothetical protein